MPPVSASVSRLPLPPNRIARLRRASGLKGPEVARFVGVHEATLYRWEKGEVGVRDDQKYILAQLFKVSVPFLMGWTDDKEAA